MEKRIFPYNDLPFLALANLATQLEKWLFRVQLFVVPICNQMHLIFFLSPLLGYIIEEESCDKIRKHNAKLSCQVSHISLWGFLHHTIFPELKDYLLKIVLTKHRIDYSTLRTLRILNLQQPNNWIH